MVKMTAANLIVGTSSTSPCLVQGVFKVGTRGARPSEVKRPAALVDTRMVCCGDNLEQFKHAPSGAPSR